MAEIRDITLRVKADASGLRVISVEAKKVGNELDKAGKKAESTFSKFNKQLGISSETLKRFTLAATAAAAVIGTFAIKQAINFESSFAGIRKTVNATEAEFAALERGIRDLAKDIPINVNELNRIGEAAGQLGIQTENILDFVDVMAKLGVTTNLSSEEAATALARLANITQLPQSEFDRLGSTIVELGNNLATTEAEIVDFGLRLAGAGSQIGLTEAQILGLGAALSSLGLSSEAGGTAFSRVMLEIASAVETGSNQLSQFADVAGFTTEEFKQRFRQDAVGAINAFIVGLGDMEIRGQSTIQVLETMGLTEIRLRDALLRASGAGDILTRSLKISEEAWEQNNALTEEAEKRFQTTASQLQLLWNRVRDLGIVLGSELLPRIIDTVNKLSDWIDRNEKLIAQDLKNFVTGLETAVKNLGTAFSLLVGDINGVNGAFQTLGTTMLAINEGILLVIRGIREFNQIRITDLRLREFIPGDPLFLKGEEVERRVSELERQKARVDKAIDDIERRNVELARKIISPEGPQRVIGDTSRIIQSEVSPALDVLDKQVEELNNTQFDFIFGNQRVQGTMVDWSNQLQETKEKVDNLSGADGGGGLPLLTEETEKAEKAVQDLERQQESFTENLLDQAKELKKSIELFGATNAEIIKYEANELRAEAAAKDLSNQVSGLIDLIELLGLELDQLKIAEKFTEQVEGLSDEFLDSLTGATEAAEGSLTALEVFAGDTFSTISRNFSDLIFNTLTGDFDSLKDLWKGTLDTMLRSFIDFVIAVATQNIVLNLSGRDGEGPLPSVADVFSGVGDSFKSLGGLFGIGEGQGGGFLDELGKALPAIGIVVTGVGLIVDAISGLFKKTPRLDIDFDSIKVEGERRAAFVAELLDSQFFIDVIAQISVKRGGVGLGLGGDEGIKRVIQERLAEIVGGLQDIINTLPADIAATLNDLLLNAQLDIDTVIGDERFLEFDTTKKIAERFQTFIESELPAKFFGAIRESFFDPALQALGVSADATQDLIDQFLADLGAAGSREARGQIGEQFLQDFATFVEAFNVLNGTASDSISLAINQIESLSQTLGFEAVPSIQELDQALESFVQAADAEAVRNILDLRNALLQLRLEIVSSISSIIGQIQSLNSTIASIGGSIIGVTGFINTAVDDLQNLLSTPGLSLDDQELILGELGGLANALLAEEQAAFQQQQAAIQRANEAQRGALQSRIDGLNREKQRIQEVNRERLDALNEELRIAQDFANLTESIRRTLDSILFSPESVLTGVEQVSLIQSDIARLQRELLQAVDPARQLDLAGQLEDAFSNLFGVAGDAFGVNSPEFVAIFDQVTGGLEALADLTEQGSRSVEEINAEIERLTEEGNRQLENIDARIQAAQNALSSINTQTAQNTFQASARLLELFEFIRGEYIRILEERFEQLEEVSELGFSTELGGLAAIVNVNQDQLTVLRNIEIALGNVQGFQHGSDGVRDFGAGQLALLHGREAVIPERDLNRIAIPQQPRVIGDINITLAPTIEATSTSPNADRELPKNIVKELIRFMRNGGEFSEAIKEVVFKAMR